MTELRNLTVAQLRQVVSIKEQIESLTAELEAIADEAPIPASAPALVAPVNGRGMYKRSPAARAAMAAAQKARWAKSKGKITEVTKVEATPKKRKMSAAGRAKIAAAAKKRWTKVKAAGRNTL